MMNNWNSLPDAIKDFKTPYSEIVVMRTETEGLLAVFTFSSSETQRFTIATNGRINSDETVLIADAVMSYDTNTDTWKEPTNRSYGVNKYITNLSTLSSASEAYVLYSTVDLYDSTFTDLLREKDEAVNCRLTDYYEFDQKLLISEVKAVFDVETDAILVKQNTNASRVDLCVVKNASQSYFHSRIASSNYYVDLVDEADVHLFTINRDDYSLYSSKVERPKYIFSTMATKGKFRDLLEFTSLDIKANTNESVLVFPAQELVVESEVLPESITATPATITDFTNTTHQLSVEVLPAEAEDKSVSFISDKKEVATVDENGLITLKSEGTATITIVSKRVPELSTQVIVNAIRPYEKPVISQLSVTPTSPTETDTISFNYEAIYDRATFKAEEWENKQERYEAGTHTVRVRVQDSHELWSDWKELTFNVEAVYQQPTISNLVMAPSQPGVGEEVSFIYDKNLDSRLQVKSENWTNKQSSYEAGVHTVKLSITDTADQTSNELSLTFSIEQPLESPVIDNLRITPTSPNAGEKVSFYYDKVIDERLTLKTENWTGKQDTYEAGQHTVTLSITDSADQVSNELSLTFDVAYVPEVPILESISISPAVPVAGETVEFSYQALIDEEAEIKEEIWEGKQETYEAGVHEVALTIVDSFNQRSNRLTFSFTVENPPQPEPDPEPDPDLPPVPSEFPHIYDITVDPPQPRAGELLSYSYCVGLEAGTSIEKMEWQNKKLIYEEAGVVDVALKVVDSRGQEAMRSISVEIIEASETPLPPKPVRIKHLEITRWDSASKRFLILEGREK